MAESNQPAPPPDTPARAVRRLQMAYREVFGGDGARTPAQALVWRDLESFCHAFRLSVEQVQDGEMVLNNCLVNEGRRSYWLRARGQILLAQSPEKPALKVNRQRKP